MNKPIYKHTFTVVVFSEEKTIDQLAGLDEINYQITEGHCVGDTKFVSSVEVPTCDIETELQAIGNDGLFFNMGEEEDEDE